MKKILAFLLCLTLAFAVACNGGSSDSVNDSSAVDSRDKISSEQSESGDSSDINKYRPDYDYGTCKQLRGDVLIVLFFLDDFESKWTRDDISRFTTNEVMPALRFLERSAESHGVELSFTTDTNYGITYNGEVIRSAHESDYVTADTLRQAVKALYYNSDTDFIAQMKQVHGVDEVVCFTIFNKDGTAYALNPKRDSEFTFEEHCLLFVRDHHTEDAMPAGHMASVTAHEMLHLFGAEDYYAPENRKKLAQKHMPNDIMIRTAYDLSENEFGDTTAFYIGWTDKLPEIIKKEEWN